MPVASEVSPRHVIYSFLRRDYTMQYITTYNDITIYDMIKLEFLTKVLSEDRYIKIIHFVTAYDYNLNDGHLLRKWLG